MPIKNNLKLGNLSSTTALFSITSATTPSNKSLLSQKTKRSIYFSDASELGNRCSICLEFDKYSKGEYNQDVIKDLFGHGIFAVDGDKWRQQRKLASFEFSTRVLRDFSCAVFRTNAAKLVKVITEFAVMGRVLDMQVSNVKLK